MKKLTLFLLFIAFANLSRPAWCQNEDGSVTTPHSQLFKAMCHSAGSNLYAVTLDVTKQLKNGAEFSVREGLPWLVNCFIKRPVLSIGACVALHRLYKAGRRAWTLLRERERRNKLTEFKYYLLRHLIKDAVFMSAVGYLLKDYHA